MAEDIHTLYHECLGIHSAVIVGHDIGSMVAYALAAYHSQDVKALVIMGEARTDINVKASGII